MNTSEWIALFALLVAVPAMTIGIINAIKNKFNLACCFKINRNSELYEDIKEETPSNYFRLFGVLEYINYSPFDFYINKIELHIENEIFPVEQLNDDSRDLMRIVYPVVPFKNIPLYQRSSGEIPLVVDLQKNTVWQSAKLYVYTSYRKQPCKRSICDLTQSQ